jgi:hypothetical protein
MRAGQPRDGRTAAAADGTTSEDRRTRRRDAAGSTMPSHAGIAGSERVCRLEICILRINRRGWAESS